MFCFPNGGNIFGFKYFVSFIHMKISENTDAAWIFKMFFVLSIISKQLYYILSDDTVIMKKENEKYLRTFSKTFEPLAHTIHTKIYFNMYILRLLNCTYQWKVCGNSHGFTFKFVSPTPPSSSLQKEKKRKEK